MSNGTPVAVTAFSSFGEDDVLSEIVIGGNEYTPNGMSPQQSFFWLAVIDLTDLQVVVSDVSDGSSVPSDVSQYVGNSQYFLYALSNTGYASQLPQGDLYALLQKVGAGQSLATLEQIYGQLGTGMFAWFSYVLGAAMDESVPGFEAMSLNHHAILTMGFLPITVDGQTIYAPISSGSA